MTQPPEPFTPGDRPDGPRSDDGRPQGPRAPYDTDGRGSSRAAPAPRRAWWPARVPVRLRLPLAVYAACQAVLLLWWAAFYPGRVTGDSLTYLYEVSTSHWRSDHSVAYDALLWLSLQLSGGVAALTLIQTIVMSVALAYVCVALRDLGVRGRWSAPVAFICAAAPPTGSLTIYVWKDTAFTLAALVAFGAVIRLTARRLRGEQRVRGRAFTRDMVVLGVGCLGIGLFRNNGFPVIIAAGVVLVLVLPGMRRWTAAATAIPLAAALLMNNFLYPALGVQQPRADEVYAFNYADIGVAYAKRPDTFTVSDLRLMAQIAPLSHWSGPGGDCHVADPIMHQPMNRMKAGRMNGRLLSLWGRILRRTPSLIIDARLCRADIAWEFTGHTGLYPTSNRGLLASWSSFGYSSAQQLPWGGTLHTRPLSTRVYKAGARSVAWTEKPHLQPLLWRGDNWTYVGYLVVLLLIARRRRYELLALLALPLALQVTVIVANPSPLWRYMCASLFLGVLTLPALVLLGRRDSLPTARPPREAAAPQTPPQAAAEPPARSGQDTARVWSRPTA
jgi:Family of unknown function (DUF6020)